MLRLDLEHEETHGGRPNPGPPSPVPAPESPQSRTDAFRRLYDTFVVLALAFSVLEALMFRLGRRRIAANAERWRRTRGAGGGSFLSTGALESLLDEEDIRHAGWEDWRGETVQQVGAGVCERGCGCAGVGLRVCGLLGSPLGRFALLRFVGFCQVPRRNVFMSSVACLRF